MKTGSEWKLAQVDIEKGVLQPIQGQTQESVTAFFLNFLQSFIDSYLIVGMSLVYLQEIGATIELRKLTYELHLCIQELYQMGIIKYMNSCLIETINTAILRFADLGVCEALSYDT